MKTYFQILESIEALKKQAEAVRQKEITGVVSKIKDAINAYGLTAKDLGLDLIASVAGKGKPGRKPRVAKAGPASSIGKTKSKGPMKFRDADGNVWSGRGPRPHWLRAQLDAGRQLSDFLIDASSVSTASAAAPTAPQSAAAGESAVAPSSSPAKKTRQVKAKPAAKASRKASAKTAPKALKLVEKKATAKTPAATKRVSKKPVKTTSSAPAAEGMAVAA